MARVAVVITKKEYEQAHKDRRTRLVDIVALLVGLLMLTGGVGAVWGIEEQVPPQTDWTVQWNDVDKGGKACSAEPNPAVTCALGQIRGEVSGVGVDYLPEGETQRFPVEVPPTDVNITEVSIKLIWADETVEYEGWTGSGRDSRPSGAEIPSSWDCMTLTVTGPTGETDTGSHCGGRDEGDGGTIGGLVVLKFPFAPKPNITEAHGKRAEVVSEIVQPPTTGGIGVWTFEVKLDSAGDVRGNQTKTACEKDPNGQLCPALIEQFDSNQNNNQGACRAAQFLVCNGARKDTYQEWYLHVEWNTYNLRQLV